jgi:hypothetical protein
MGQAIQGRPFSFLLYDSKNLRQARLIMAGKKQNRPEKKPRETERIINRFIGFGNTGLA